MVSISGLPSVSIIMPIRNEEAFIGRSLAAVLAQDYPAEKMEVIVADGMSDDATLEIIKTLPSADRIRVIANPRRIQAAGLNIAIEQAHGKYIIRVDGHTIIAPNYVRRCIEILQESQAQNVGGPMNPVGSTTMGKAIATAGKSSFAVPSTFHISQQAQYTDTVYLGAWPREVFEQVGGFDENCGVNEDYELNYRIRKSGGKIFFSPELHSLYYGRHTLSALMRQYYRYGRSKVMTLRKHPESLRWRQTVAPIFVLAVAGGFFLALFFDAARFMWLAGVCTYFIINLIFSVRLAAERGWENLWRLVLIFAVLHLAWGVGFWMEIISPTKRQKTNNDYPSVEFRADS
jgi:succinoglycan biosynthesis protein ExoA